MSAQTASAVELHPDEGLIGLCRECDALRLRFQATFRDELALNSGVGLQEKRRLITRLQGNVLDQIWVIHATTLRGLRARNRVNLLDSLLGPHWAERMAEALRRDTVGQLAAVKDAGARPGPSLGIPAPPNESQPTLQDDESADDCSAGGPQADGRRPGHLKITNSNLVELLRDCSMAGDVYKGRKPDGHPGLARTIVVRLVLSVPSWVALALLAYILVRTLGLPARS